MGLLSKWLGIDARRNAQKQAEEQAKATAKAAADAQALQEQVAAQQKTYQDSMLNMQRENTELASVNKELSTDTVANVVAGGTADEAASGDLLKKKQRIGTGLAATLGINV
jgi:hypothetical protein